MTTILEEHGFKVYEIMNTIYAKVSNRNSDLQICLPALGQKLGDMLEVHFHSTQHQIIKLGRGHPRIVRDLNQEHARIVEVANQALTVCNKVLFQLDDGPEIGSTKPQGLATKATTTSVKTAVEATTVPTTTHTMAESRTATQPPRPMLTRILKEHNKEILEVAQTIHDNIDQQRADLLVCIPQLRMVMCDLMEEHLTNVKMLATERCTDHTLLAREMNLEQLEVTVNEALRHINHMVMDTEEDWAKVATNHATHKVATAVQNQKATNPQASPMVAIVDHQHGSTHAAPDIAAVQARSAEHPVVAITNTTKDTVTDLANRDQSELPGSLESQEGQKEVTTANHGQNGVAAAITTAATITQDHIDQVQSPAEAIWTVASVNHHSENMTRLPASTVLPKVNEISSKINDAANSSPLGPWTGLPMDVATLNTADVTTIMVSTGGGLVIL